MNILDHIKIIEENIKNMDIIYHLKGLFYYNKGEYNNALKNFRFSIYYNDKMWLSHFYIAKILQKEKIDIACNEYEVCRNLLEQKEANLFDFLLLDIDRKYFLNICCKLFEKGKNN